MKPQGKENSTTAIANSTTDSGSSTVNDNQVIVVEAKPKSVKERTLRHVRPPNPLPRGRKLEPAAPTGRGKRNDPRSTTQGRSNFRGHKKRKQDEWKRNHPEKFSEARDLIVKYYKKPIDESAVGDVCDLPAVAILAESLGDRLDGGWLKELRRAIIKAAVPGRQVELCGKFGDWDGLAACESLAKDIASQMQVIYSDVIIERRESPRLSLKLWTIKGSAPETSWV